MRKILGENIQYTRNMYLLAFTVLFFMSCYAFFKNMMIFYKGWADEFTVNNIEAYINAFGLLWYLWLPSLMCILFSILFIKVLYKKGSIIKGLKETMDEIKKIQTDTEVT